MTYVLLAFAVVALGGVIYLAARATSATRDAADQRSRADRAELDRDQARAALTEATDRVQHLTGELAAMTAERDRLQAEAIKTLPGNKALAEVI